MKKKLLTILLSMLMLATAFTTNVFAYTSATITVSFDTSKGSVTMTGGMKTESPQTYVLESIENNYSITLPANDIIQFDDEQDALSVAAVPKEGYVFSKWQLDGVDLTEDGTRTGDATLTPIFVAGTPESLDVTISYDSTKGIVKNTNTQETVVNSTTFAMNCLTNNKFNILYDDEDPTWLNFYDKPMVNDYAIEAIANDNYRFVEWKVNSTKLTGSINLSVDAIIEAVFELNNPQVTIASILPGNFPTTFETGWKRADGVCVVYKDTANNNLVVTKDNTYSYTHTYSLDTVLEKVDDSKYVYHGSEDQYFYVENSFVYKMDIKEDTSGLSGTYEAPKTLAKILNTVEGGFPIADDGDIPTNAWTNSNDKKAYIDNGKLIVGNETFFSKSVDETIAKESDNVYYASIGIRTVYFNVDSNGVLQSLELLGASDNDYNGEYTMPPKTVGTILASINNFPQTKLNAWVNSKLHRLYMNSNYIYIDDKQMLSFNTLVTENSDSYECEVDGINYIFYKYNNVVDRLYISGFTGDKANYNGYYLTATVGTVICTNPDAPGPVGDKYFINSNDETIQFKTYWFTSYSLYDDSKTIYVCSSADLVIESEGNLPYTSTYTFTNSDDVTIKINMYNDVAQSLVISGFEGNDASYNGKYLLPHKVNDFPESISLSTLEDAEFVTNAFYENEADVTVKIDDNDTELILNTDYTLSRGSTHVLLKKEYLSKLSSGEHELHVKVEGYDTVDMAFSIIAAPSPKPSPYSRPVPNTGVK